MANELSYLNEEPIRHISSLENPEEHPDPLLTRRYRAPPPTLAAPPAVADAAAQRVVRRRGPAVGAPAPTWRAVRQTLGARRAERAEPPRGASAAGTALDQWPLVEGRVTPLRRAPPQPSTRRRGVHASQWSDQFTELI